MNEVIEFIKQNKEFYPEYFINNRLEKCNYGYTCDVDQIYCYLNKVNIKTTIYNTFYNITKKYFDLKNKRILEVGCGKIPILSGLFKDNNINIDAIDSNILINNYKDITTIKYDLQKEYDISKYDLIIGLRPCNITENIIDMCFKYKKDFIIYLCPCIHKSKNNNIFNTYEEWISYLKDKISNNKEYSFEFIYSNNLPDNCPIIIGKYNGNIFNKVI